MRLFAPVPLVKTPRVVVSDPEASFILPVVLLTRSRPPTCPGTRARFGLVEVAVAAVDVATRSETEPHG